jgi:DNA-binding CsgD family transcriptional regulator
MSVLELIDPPSTRPPAELRPEIEVSWRDCVAMGLRPDRFVPRRDGDIVGDGAVLRAGHAVVERLGRDLHGTGVAVVLVDEGTRIVDRQPGDEITRRRLDALGIAPGFTWRVDAVGTNALGLATSHRTSATVHGREHFMDVLTPLTTVAAPVSDPRTGQLSGALALVGPADMADVLLLAMARHGAHDIEQRLADGATPRQRLLNDTFRRHRRHTRGPLVLVDDETLLMNAVAAGTFTDGDRPLLWDRARQAVGSDGPEPFVFTTRDGTALRASVKPVYEHGAMIAALVEFHGPGEPAARVTKPSFGWDSLTASEHGLIGLIADGLTNREAAARLYVSHHTIDSHLRHIFRKLGINSRVQLARIATSMSPPPTAESA